MINTKYKDRLFTFIFGNAERKEWTLSLYNAVNGSSYTNPDDIMFMTMDDVLYMGMKNDLSFLVTDLANMYEQQSTYNPNMPVRKLMYAARMYDRYIHLHKLNIYSTKQVRLPVPKLVTFYNGREDMEDSILELKDAFLTEDGQPVDAESDIQVRVRMININYGKNKERRGPLHGKGHKNFHPVKRQEHHTGERLLRQADGTDIQWASRHLPLG